MMANEKKLIEVQEAKQFANTFLADPILKMAANAVLDNAPAADAVEVVHGRWVEVPSMAPEYKCSECGQTFEWWEPDEAHYCPNCGAKMDGERKE